MKQLLKLETELLADFHDSRTGVIKLEDIRKFMQFYPRCHPYRIYALFLINGGMRPAEPFELTWDHITEEGTVIFRPNKTKGKIKRKFRLSAHSWEEIKEYRGMMHHGGNIFGMTTKGKISHNSIRQNFNRRHRHKLGGRWSKYSEDLRKGKISQYYQYTFRSFRTTTATLLFFYNVVVYGSGEMALHRTADWMGHSSTMMTAKHYQKKINGLGIDKYMVWGESGLPILSFHQLIDKVIYNDCSKKLMDFMPERQARVFEW